MSVRSIAGRRTTKLSVLAAGALVALTGCGAVHPGVAAVVGDATITDEQVDTLADTLCVGRRQSEQVQGRPSDPIALKGLRDEALQYWVEGEINRQFGESVGAEVDQQRLTQALAANEQLLPLLPDENRAVFQDAARTVIEGQLILEDVGREAVGATASDAEVLAAAHQQRRDFVQDLEIEIDPRYGTIRNLDTVVPAPGSLSVPVSPEARAASREQVSPELIAQLPASQQCLS